MWRVQHDCNIVTRVCDAALYHARRCFASTAFKIMRALEFGFISTRVNIYVPAILTITWPCKLQTVNYLNAIVSKNTTIRPSLFFNFSFVASELIKALSPIINLLVSHKQMRILNRFLSIINYKWVYFFYSLAFINWVSGGTEDGGLVCKRENFRRSDKENISGECRIYLQERRVNILIIIKACD